ncbi:MAG: ATP-binding protein, partial [Spirochaetales bacterium]|nr:ATP-binding protein [Spirochaetales bacterium]
GERLIVEYDVNAPGETKIPPFTLQPIIENSIKHGIRENLQSGLIRIGASRENREILFSVTDNGVGMGRDLIESALNQGNGGDSIGLKNINERLELLYGRGLKISSKKGRGTTVIFSVPEESIS